MYMCKTTDKTEIILPLINKALETARQRPAEVVQGDYGLPCLRFPTGERLRIRQLGVLTAAMLPMLGEDGNPGKAVNISTAAAWISTVVACRESPHQD